MGIFHFFTTDRKLRTLLREKIKWDRRVSNADIRVDVIKGSVRLTGEVDSLVKVQAAANAISEVKGVTEILNNIRVPIRFHRSDKDLHQKILRRMEQLEVVNEEAISVRVSGGVVTATGTVDTPQAKGLMAGIVWPLSGVRDFNNLITIENLVPESNVSEVFSNVLLPYSAMQTETMRNLDLP